MAREYGTMEKPAKDIYGYPISQDTFDDVIFALREVRKWVGDGELSDDKEIRTYWTSKYEKMIALVDAALQKSGCTL